ncbi:hypothetical protein XU18_0223 [Perkinsela sp. CCAP 1560/4]|nr:hypothetical protein XU18_0223 [Perkinsela sp. CCAP 1560/4]|eukprot:KNH09538.1 hypothetical protein XU18_0223 [Perkinsela sp. CCAP 1560/4]
MLATNTLVIYLSVRSDEAVSRIDLKIKLLSLGANIATDWQAANFVVYHNGSKETVIKARQKNIPVVNTEWVLACFEANRIIPWDGYDVAPIDNSPPLSKDTTPVCSTATTSQVHDLTTSTSQNVVEREVDRPVLHPQLADPELIQPFIIIMVSGHDQEWIHPIVEEMGANYIENPYKLVQPNRASVPMTGKATLTEQATKVSELKNIRLEDASKFKQSNSPFQEDFFDECSGLCVNCVGPDGGIRPTNGYMVLVDTLAKEQKNRSLKHIFCYALGGVPIVHPSWLYQCLSEKKWVSTQSHQTTSYQAHVIRKKQWLSNNPERALKSPARDLLDPIPIFRGLQFYLWGEIISPSREEMMCILSLAGGEIILKKPRGRKRKEIRTRTAHDLTPDGSPKIFAVYSEEDKSLNWHAESYAPIHQSNVFNSLEECKCTFYIL